MRSVYMLLVAALLATVVSPALARPVSYPDGWTVMQMNDSTSHSLHIHYSPTIHYSIGYKGEYFRDGEWQFHGVQYNTLLRRWNKPDSQANLYTKSALGFAYGNEGTFNHRAVGAGFAGIAADWEDRRLFTMYENRLSFAGSQMKEFSQKARIGIAPYIGNYGDLHTWLMVQLDHAPSAKHDILVTPLVRLFKGPMLVELGMNNNGRALLNIVRRF